MNFFKLDSSSAYAWSDFSISQYALIQMLVIGLLLFLVLRLLKRFLSRKTRFQNFLDRSWAVIETIIWMLFLITSIRTIILNPKHYTLIIIAIVFVLLVWIAWFAFKDLVAGMMLKLEGSLRLNERVMINDITGNIKKLSYFSLLIETDTGQQVSMPYHLVKNKEKIKENNHQLIYKESFVLKTNRSLTATEVENTLMFHCINAPWSVPNRKPIILLTKETADYFAFDVSVFLLSKKYSLKFKTYLEAKLADIFMND